MTISRRDFVARSAAVGLGLPVAAAAAANVPAPAAARPITIFSKPLQWLSYEELGAMIAEIGFDGIDLPVRPGGHVLPERVADDLPRAYEAFRKAGVALPLITTAIDDPRSPATDAILRTASGLGIRYYRMNALSYPGGQSIPEALDGLRVRMRDLAEVNRRHGVHGAYQNHAGVRVGSPVWDLWHILRELDPRWIGVQYDIRHATVEGGTSWPLGLKLLAPHITSIDVKDFIWSRNSAGRWRIENVPLGEGMVDFANYFKLVRELGISGPISVHYEYAPYESMAKPASPKEHVRRAVTDMRRDLTTLREMLDAAGIATGPAPA
ncbi:MAG: sugar phosphate isomerase/epimerase [Gemmatimonadetes bacterium]|nr:sugar phosphate isomerase/epimerase [Gemmatimonadota bacterium]